jgi:hypothetical protein
LAGGLDAVTDHNDVLRFAAANGNLAGSNAKCSDNVCLRRCRARIHNLSVSSSDCAEIDIPNGAKKTAIYDFGTLGRIGEARVNCSYQGWAPISQYDRNFCSSLPKRGAYDSPRSLNGIPKIDEIVRWTDNHGNVAAVGVFRLGTFSELTIQWLYGKQ